MENICKDIPVKLGQTIYTCILNEYRKGKVVYIKLYKNYYCVGVSCNILTCTNQTTKHKFELHSEDFEEVWFKNKKHLFEIKGNNIKQAD